MGISQADFDKVVATFAGVEDARDQLWFRARTLLLHGYSIEAYILVLATWNFAYFRYILKDLDLAKFASAMAEVDADLERLKGVTFENADLTDLALQADIKRAYGTLKDLVGQTGASKLLALKRDDLFVMWDTAIRAMYKIDNRGRPDDYITFLTKMKSEFGGISSSNKERPLAKLIDEYNFVLAPGNV